MPGTDADPAPHPTADLESHAASAPTCDIASPPSLARRPVGEIVAEDYRRAAVLRRFGINFCCQGGRPLAEACATRSVDPRNVEAAIRAQDARVAAEGGPTPEDPVALVEYMEREHHAWLRDNLPALLHFTGRVAKVHGAGRPELAEIAECTRELAREMEAQMAHEEVDLFPRVRAGAEVDPAALTSSHEASWVLMRELRELTGDFVAPDGACATWRAAYAKLEEFEVDLHHHAELESEVLPRLLAG